MVGPEYALQLEKVRLGLYHSLLNIRSDAYF